MIPLATFCRMKRDAESEPQAICSSSQRQLPVPRALYARTLTLLHDFTVFTALFIIPLFRGFVKIVQQFFRQFRSIPSNFSVKRATAVFSGRSFDLSSRNDSLLRHKVQKSLRIFLMLGFGGMSAGTGSLPNVNTAFLSAKAIHSR